MKWVAKRRTQLASDKKILIVEDETEIRELLTSILKMEGYQVAVASNGQEALIRLREVSRPSIILLDMIMPVMNGMEFLELKRKEPLFADIPVCIVSGVSEAPNLDSPDVVGFIKKPFRLEVLLELISKISVSK